MQNRSFFSWKLIKIVFANRVTKVSFFLADPVNGVATLYDLARRRQFEGQKLADHRHTHTHRLTKSRMEAALRFHQRITLNMG